MFRSRVGDRRPGRQVGLEPPVRLERRPRRHGDVAADVGALVERAPGELPSCARPLPPMQAAELRSCRPARRSGRWRGGPLTVAATSCRRRARRGERPARHRPADFGLAQQVAERVIALAGEVARRLRLHRVADRGQRDRGRRDDGGGPRHRLERRRLGERRRLPAASRRRTCPATTACAPKKTATIKPPMRILRIASPHSRRMLAGKRRRDLVA